jgi:hypothetical protein
MTYAELARKIGVSQQTVFAYEMVIGGSFTYAGQAVQIVLHFHGRAKSFRGLKLRFLQITDS